jgi:hypothetical protein
MTPERKLGKTLATGNAKVSALRPPVRGNVFGNPPHPIPVTRQLPGNRLPFLA